MLAAVRPAVREQRLRRTVRRLRFCLDGLPALERRVLVLRSGLGPAEPRSRRQVARRLELGTRRVARLERRALRHLRADARDGGCGGGAAPAASPPAASSPPATFASLAPVALRTAVGTQAPRPTGQVEVKGEQESSSKRKRRDSFREPAVADEPVPGEPPSAVVRPPGGNATDYTLPLIVALVLLGAAFGGRELWRARHD